MPRREFVTPALRLKRARNLMNKAWEALRHPSSKTSLEKYARMQRAYIIALRRWRKEQTKLAKQAHPSRESWKHKRRALRTQYDPASYRDRTGTVASSDERHSTDQRHGVDLNSRGVVWCRPSSGTTQPPRNIYVDGVFSMRTLANTRRTLIGLSSGSRARARDSTRDAVSRYRRCTVCTARPKFQDKRGSRRLFVVSNVNGTFRGDPVGMSPSTISPKRRRRLCSKSFLCPRT
jgi:hypothetical protein